MPDWVEAGTKQTTLLAFSKYVVCRTWPVSMFVPPQGNQRLMDGGNEEGAVESLSPGMVAALGEGETG